MPKPRSIGLFPGSFNPAHAGHLHVARAGLRQLALDEIWWIPSPQNPLKPKQPPYDERAASVIDLGLPPKMRLSHIERQRGTNKTIDLLKGFEKRRDHNRYVLMIGADNFAQLPKWIEWQNITARIPIAVIARPNKTGNVYAAARRKRCPIIGISLFYKTMLSLIIRLTYGDDPDQNTYSEPRNAALV